MYGKVKVSRMDGEGKEVILTMLGESDFFGEISIIDGLARSATVTAMEDSKLFVIQREDFLDLLHSHPEIAITFDACITLKKGIN